MWISAKSPPLKVLHHIIPRFNFLISSTTTTTPTELESQTFFPIPYQLIDQIIVRYVLYHLSSITAYNRRLQAPCLTRSHLHYLHPINPTSSIWPSTSKNISDPLHSCYLKNHGKTYTPLALLFQIVCQPVAASFDCETRWFKRPLIARRP